MHSEDQILTLVREYVKDCESEDRRGNPGAVVALLSEPSAALATIEKHFDSFLGQDRFWLYALVHILTQDEQEYARFLQRRLPVEDDETCLGLIEVATKGG